MVVFNFSRDFFLTIKIPYLPYTQMCSIVLNSEGQPKNVYINIYVHYIQFNRTKYYMLLNTHTHTHTYTRLTSTFHPNNMLKPVVL